LQKLFSVIVIGVKNLGHYPIRLPERRLWVDDAVGLQSEFENVGILRDIPYHDIGEAGGIRCLSISMPKFMNLMWKIACWSHTRFLPTCAYGNGRAWIIPRHTNIF
jgi:hypothetical protein